MAGGGVEQGFGRAAGAHQGSNARRETQEEWASPQAVTLRSCRLNMATRSSSPPVATYCPSGLNAQHSSAP
jgi:hypothetical protein